MRSKFYSGSRNVYKIIKHGILTSPRQTQFTVSLTFVRSFYYYNIYMNKYKTKLNLIMQCTYVTTLPKKKSSLIWCVENFFFGGGGGLSGIQIKFGSSFD